MMSDMTMSDAERRLVDRGLRIEEADLEAANPTFADDPDRIGLMWFVPVDAGHTEIALLVRMGTTPERRAKFAEFAEQRIDSAFEIGPQADGWTPRPVQGGWQLLARLVMLPSMAFLAEVDLT